MTKFIVYKHTCTINGKSYIGVTSQTIEHRWDEHCADAISRENGRKFLRAINKYGVDAWISEILHTVDSFEEALVLEVKEIAAHDTLKNGYNSTIGGEGTHGFKHKPEGVAKRSGANHVQAKTYIVTFPDGREDTISGLTFFCKANGLDYKKAHETTWNANRNHKGFRFRLVGAEPVLFKPNKPGPRITSEQRIEIANLALSGMKIREIAIQFGVSDVTVSTLKRKVLAGESLEHMPKTGRPISAETRARMSISASNRKKA